MTDNLHNCRWNWKALTSPVLWGSKRNIEIIFWLNGLGIVYFIVLFSLCIYLLYSIFGVKNTYIPQLKKTQIIYLMFTKNTLPVGTPRECVSAGGTRCSQYDVAVSVSWLENLTLLTTYSLLGIVPTISAPSYCLYICSPAEYSWNTVIIKHTYILNI